MPKPIQHDNRCELFGAFGFFVQFFLGFISFGSLIGMKFYKLNTIQHF